jgi:uncharacterized protein YbjQ (UPF0145 family)
MTITTTPSIEGKQVEEYLGIVMGREMANQAADLGANAVVGVDIDYEVIGKAGSMLMVTSAGTAVRVR